MPTYQYACTACEHRFEAVQSFSDASLTDCPECAGRLRKVFSSVGIVFKGSGFYKNDARAGAKSSSSSSESSSSDSSSSSASSSGSDSSSSSSSDTKSSDKKTEKTEKKADKKPAAAKS